MIWGKPWRGFTRTVSEHIKDLDTVVHIKHVKDSKIAHHLCKPTLDKVEREKGWDEESLAKGR
jgi:hypothetical protein